MQSSLILWDWDNTLVDSFEAIFAAQNVMRAFYGMSPWTKQQSKEAMNFSGKNIIKNLVGSEKEIEAREIFLKAYAESASQLKLKAYAIDVLRYTYENGFINVLASNKTSSILKKEAHVLNVDTFFHRIIGAGEASQDKPSKVFTDKAIEDFIFNRLICIGDGCSDMKMAGNYSNAISILIGNDVNKAEFQSVTIDYVCPTLKEVTHILEGLKNEENYRYYDGKFFRRCRCRFN